MSASGRTTSMSTFVAIGKALAAVKVVAGTDAGGHGHPANAELAAW